MPLLDIVTPTYRDAILNSPGIASYWRMGEASGSVIDLVGGITGTVSGTVTRNVAPLIALSNDGAIDFNGTTGHIFCGDNYDFAGTLPFSAMAWVNVDALTSTVRVFGKDGANGWRLAYNLSGNVLFARVDLGTDTATFTSGLSTGTTTQLTGTYDGARLIVYVNGVASAATASTRSLSGNVALLTLGSDPGGTANAFIDGRMDEAAIWSRALSPGEITEFYRIGRGY